MTVVRDQAAAAPEPGLGGRLCWPAGERGFTLIEVLVAATVLLAGIASTLGVFTSAKRVSLTTQRHEVAVGVAQQELDAMRALDYGDLVPDAGPGDPGDPRHAVGMPYFGWKSCTGTPASGCYNGYQLEYLVPADSAGNVKPGPEPFTVGSGTAAVTGKVYRYVTWRNDGCPSLCPDYKTKRIVVAVEVDSSPNQGIGPSRPVWMSSIVNDPGSAGAWDPPDPVPGGNLGRKAGLFYLYDTSCRGNNIDPPTANHATHDTAALNSDPDPDPSRSSRCQNLGGGLPTPDLMGNEPTRNPEIANTPPYPSFFDLSNDLAGATYPGGLRMVPQGASSAPCASAPTSYPSIDSTTPGTLNRWNVHAWSTNPLPADLTLTGKVTLSLHAATVNGVPATGRMCATLIERDEGPVPPAAQVNPTDIRLGSFEVTHTVGDQASEVAQFDAAGAVTPTTIPAGRRLVLVLSMRSNSDTDVVLAYGHPFYPSLLNVETPSS